MFPEVMKRVTGDDFERRGATLYGYARRSLSGRTYPGIVEAPDNVLGVLYRVDGRALSALDAFEGSEYERIEVEVEPDSGGKTRAYVYALSSEGSELLTQDPWMPDAESACLKPE